MSKSRSNRRAVEPKATGNSLSLFDGAAAQDVPSETAIADASAIVEAKASDSANSKPTDGAIGLHQETNGPQSIEKRVGRSRADAAPVRKPRYLLEGETRLDTTTAQLVSQLSGLRWPRKWSAIRRYDLLASAEIERLHHEGGDESPLLKRVPREGGETIELSARGEEALVAREGERGFRRVIKGESGLAREYFIKRLTTSDGYIETRLSWFGAAWPLFEEASAKIESGFQAFLAQNSGPQRSLFEELDAAERERADGQLRLMESVRNGRLVIDYLMRTFGRDGANPVRVAAWDLRALLGCENDPHGMRRVRGCLEALSEIRFEMHLKGGAHKARSLGALISEVQYSGGGGGDHGDGWFAIHLAPSALGCLSVFGVESEAALPRPRTIAPAALDNASEFDWQRSLSPAERERLRSGFTRSQMALAPHYDRAHGLSGAQAELLRWIERQLTQQRDASRFKGTAVTPGDRTPRLYSRIFCPALPQGRTFLGALGHFRDRPERGRKLASLAREIGLMWPSTRAKVSYRAAVEALLSDLRLIVEEVLDGAVVVCLPGEGGRSKRRGENWNWRLLDDTNEFSPEFLAAHGTFLCFISPDYGARLIEKLERYYQERFERGETPYLIKVRRADEITAVPATQTSPLDARGVSAVSAMGTLPTDAPEITGVSKTQTSPTDTPEITGFAESVSKTGVTAFAEGVSTIKVSKTDTPEITRLSAAVSVAETSPTDTCGITVSASGVSKIQISPADTPGVTGVSETEILAVSAAEWDVIETAFTPHGSQTTLNSRLKATRIERGLTQTQVAQMLGVSQAMVSKWEKGAPQAPGKSAAPTPISEEFSAKIIDWIINSD